MNSSVFIVPTTLGSLKSLVTLGSIKMMIKKSKKVSFFRPIINDNKASTKEIISIFNYFNIKMKYEDSFVFTREQALNLYEENNQNKEIILKIISKYKNLQESFDSIVVEGHDPINNWDFEINKSIANSINIPVILVINGEYKSPKSLSNEILMASLSFKNLIMIVINNTSFEKDEIMYFIDGRISNEIRLAVIPTETLLMKPTLGEIKEVLDANIINCDLNSLNLNIRVYTYIYGYMPIHNFMHFYEKNSLVITSCDRYDLIFATILAKRKNIVGMIITDYILPEKKIFSLIETANDIPIMTVGLDFVKTIKIIPTIISSIYQDRLKIKRSLEIFDTYCKSCLLEDNLKSFNKSYTPNMFRYNLFQKSKVSNKHIVLPEGKEDRILRAAYMFVSEGLGKITLLGDAQQIFTKASKLGLDFNDYNINIINPNNSEYYDEFSKTLFELRKEKGLQLIQAKDLMLDASYFGTMMVYKGLADGMVSGAINTTANTIRPAFQFIKTIPDIKIVSSIFFMLLHDRVMVYGDCAIIPDPNPEQLADITIVSAKTAKNFGLDPKIALLSYSTGNSGKGLQVEKVIEATNIVKRRAPELLVDGPLQYDAAVDPLVGKQKMPDSIVAGQANVLIFPDLNTGNNTYKAVQRETKSLAIGPVLQGLKKPINDISRGATVEDIYNTILVTSIQASDL